MRFQQAAGDAVSRAVHRAAIVIVACSSLTGRPSPARAQEGQVRAGDAEFGESGFIYFAGQLRLSGGEGPKRNVGGIFLVDPKTGAWRRLLDKGISPRISNDGTSLVYHDAKKIWTCDARKAENPGIVADLNAGAIWSGDGKSLFASEMITANGESKWAAWQISADGLSKTRLPISEHDILFDVSPGGEWIATMSSRNNPPSRRNDPNARQYQIYIMHPDGTQERPLTAEGMATLPRFSPDGQRVLYIKNVTNGREIHAVNRDGTGDEVILAQTGPTNSIDQAAWSPDGKQLVIRRLDWMVNNQGKWQLRNPLDANFRIEIVNVDGTPTQPLVLKDVEKFIQVGSLSWR